MLCEMEGILPNDLAFNKIRNNKKFKVLRNSLKSSVFLKFYLIKTIK
jgi:hypothetical protein